jgi:hypothetical protein
MNWSKENGVTVSVKVYIFVHFSDSTPDSWFVKLIPKVIHACDFPYWIEYDDDEWPKLR